MGTPLAGVRVLELATGVAGPWAARLLADYGADVVKAEPPDGDPTRRVGPMLDGPVGGAHSALFLHLNTNKRGITLDPATAEGQDLVRRLVVTVDICVESFAPGSLEGWGLGFAALQKINPDLVLTSVTPFGQDGPYAGYRGAELVHAAMGGMNFTRAGGGLPVTLGGNLTGYHAGALVAAATTGALLHAEGGGGGTHVDISIMAVEAASADSSAVYLTAHAYTGRTSTPPPGGPDASGLGPFPNGTFACSDGSVMVSTLLQWVPRMLKAVDDPALAALLADPARLSEPGTADAVHAVVTRWFAARTKQEAMTAAQAVGWPVTAIQDPVELVDDPHLTARGAIVEAEHPAAGRVVLPGPPFRLDDGWALRRPAPALGEHDAEVRRELVADRS